MIIERKTFKEILETVKYGLAGKEESLIGSTSFYFTEGKVHTFNDSVSVSAPIPEIDFEGEVNATELLGFVSKTVGKEITVTVEGNTLTLLSGKAKAELALKTESTLPIDSIGEISKWKPLDAEFLQGISFVKHACGSDFTRPILTCVHVAETFIEGTDGFRVAFVEMKNKIPVGTFLLPATVVPYIVSIKPTHISLGKAWVHFKTENNVVLSCRIFEDTFVNTTPFRKYEGKDIVFPDNILEILNRAIIFNESAVGMQTYVTIAITNSKITVSSKSNTGRFEEKAKIAYKGEDVTFMIIVSLLQEIVKETKVGKYTGRLLVFSFGSTIYSTILMGERS